MKQLGVHVFTISLPPWMGRGFDSAYFDGTISPWRGGLWRSRIQCSDYGQGSHSGLSIHGPACYPLKVTAHLPSAKTCLVIKRVPFVALIATHLCVHVNHGKLIFMYHIIEQTCSTISCALLKSVIAVLS